MFFFSRIKKECASLSLAPRWGIKILISVWLLSATVTVQATDIIPKDHNDSWSDYVPRDWQEGIYMPVITSSIVVISKDPAASNVAGNTDVVLRYTIKNDISASDTLDDLQVVFDIANQIGSPPFVALTGSLSAMTGSGNVFGSPILIGDPVLNGLLNPLYNGVDNNDLFSTEPSLAPGECISIDIPFELGDTTSTDPIFVDARATGVPRAGGAALDQTTDPLTIISACESESLACAGKINVSIGPDCIAIISVSTVFLNQVVDPNRYSVVVYDGNLLLGDTLYEWHIGKTLRYSVLDGCFDGRASCWGEIDLENKNIPERSYTCQTVFCGEDPASLVPLESIIEDIEDDRCFIPLTGYQETYSSDVDKCDGGLIRRVITAEYEVDGWKVRDTIHVDSIKELPLEIDTISIPFGGPDKVNAIYVDCDSLNGGYPTPEFIEGYFNDLPVSTGSGTAYAYPYIDRGTTTMEMVSLRDTILESTRKDTIMVNGFPVVVNVIVKDTTTVYDTTRTIKPYLVPVKTGTTCNLTANYSDVYFPGCAGPESKIVRTWKLLNWCTGDITEFDQWIIIDDTRGPDIEMIDTTSVGVNPWDCTASYQLEAEVSDNCSAIRNLHWRASAGVIDSNNVLTQVTTSDSPVIVTLQAIDECGNDSTKILVLYVIDSIAPVAIAKDQINTNIIYDPANLRGIAKVTAEAIDAGSHNSNCGPVILCVLLEEELNNPIFTETGAHATDSLGNLLYVAAQCDIDGVYEDIPYVICRDAVKFCCEQVGEHRVALLAHDGSNASPPGISWTLVNVEDKSFPIISCRDAFVTCEDDISPDSIGYPTVSNGFCDNVSLTYRDVEDRGDCGSGQINRIWLADGDTACIQTINITGSEAFDPKTIKWPIHYDDQIVRGVTRWCETDTIREDIDDILMGSSFECGEDVLDAPVWCPTSCNLIFMSFEDTDVAASDGCKKIIRTWTLIDWCTYRPNSDDGGVDNDSFEAVDDSAIGATNTNAELVDGDLCAYCDKPSSDKSGDVFFRYTDVDVDGFYTYQQVIKVVDNTPPVVDAPETVEVEIDGGATFKGDDFDGCEGETVVSAKAIDLCSDILLDASTVRWNITVTAEDSTELDSRIAFGDSVVIKVMGTANTEQLITWHIEDGCGNEAEGQTTVIYKDIIDPTPICISDLSIATMNNSSGSATIWASDYNQGSYDNCSEVKFFFRNPDGFITSSLDFTCADIPDGRAVVKQVELFVSDEAGNESSCNVSIRIDDNNNVCIDSAVGSASITGLLMTSLGDMIEAARVSLNGRDNQMTDVTGTYAFADVPMASSYKIDGNKNNDPLNGVSTLDLVLIQRHILGIETLDDPYKVIAADINADTRVSAIDLVQLRRLLLGQIETFQSNDSWRFVDPNQEFANPNRPWPFIEGLIIDDLLQDMEEQNLIGVKIGDVNGNAIANSLLAGNRNATYFNLVIEDRQLEKGDFIEVPVFAKDGVGLEALQFTLEVESATIIGIHPGALEIGREQTALHDGQTMTVAWYSPVELKSDDALFYLQIAVREEAALSDILQVSDRITSAKAYGAEHDAMDIAVTYSNTDAAALGSFALRQNEPNPFNNTTDIGFVIPEDGQVRLILSDISGRVVHKQEGYYRSGYNEITISKDQLTPRGVIYYRLETGGHTETRKMILID